MVKTPPLKNVAKNHLSVLALSSRFDGPTERKAIEADQEAFSTRSVESF